MTSEDNEPTELPEVDPSMPAKLPFLEKYKRGLTLIEIAAVGALPFIIMWMVGGLVGVLIAIPLALLAPPLIYEAFVFSSKRGARRWLDSFKNSG